MKLTITLPHDVEGKVFISIINMGGEFGANVIASDLMNDTSFVIADLFVLSNLNFTIRTSPIKGDWGFEFESYARPR